MTDERELLQEILIRIKSIQIAIKDINEPIYQTVTRAYHEGIETGKEQVLDAMKSVGKDYSHHPAPNIYAGKRLAFDRLGFFREDVPAVCGNCVNFEHPEFSDEGHCTLEDEARVSSSVCNVTR